MARTLASLKVIITAEAAHLVTGIQKTLGLIKVLSSVATGVGKALKGMVGSIASALISARGAVVAFAAAFVAGKIARSFQETAENIEKIYRTSKRLGLATEEVSAMRYAAEQAGVEFDTLAAMMSKGAKNIAELAGGGRSSVGLGGMVLQLRDANGELLPMSELFPQIVAAISNTKSQAEKLNLANQIFGREGGAQFVDWLADTGDLVGDLAAKMKEAKDLGIVFTDEQAAKVKAYGDAANKVSQAFFGLKAKILIPLSPLLTNLSEKAASAIAKIGESVGKFIEPLAEVLPELVERVGSMIALGGDATRQALAKMGERLTAIFREIGYGAGVALLVALRETIILGFPLLWDVTKVLARQLISAFASSMADAGRSLGLNDWADAMMEAIAGGEEMTRRELKGMIDNIYAGFNDPGKFDAFGAIVDRIKSKVLELGLTADELLQFSQAWDEAKNRIQEAGAKNTLLGPKINTPTVPPFLQGIRDGLEQIISQAENLRQLGRTLTTTFIGGFTDRLSEGLARGEIRIRNFGRAVTRILGDVSQQLIKIALNAAFTRALAGIGDAWANSAPKNTAPGGVGPIPQAQGGAWNNGRIQAFGDGGVTDRPTFFATAMGRLGVMGEKNQPEGIFPLKRMPSGDLGVQASGSTSVQIIDQRGAQAPAAEVRRQPAAGGGENITVIIRDAVKSAIGNGSLDRVLGLRYGLTPAGR